MGYDIPVFATGLLFGAGLLCAGLGFGIWMGRKSEWRRWRRAKDSRPSPLRETWSRSADGVVTVVSGCRDELDRAGSPCRDAAESEDPVSHGPNASLLSEMILTSEQVRLRLEKAEETLQQQAQDISSYLSEARTDALTGLHNRRALDSELARRLAECRRGEAPLSLILIDVDHFKRLNDHHGHLAGDAVLSNIGRLLRQVVQPPDVAARFGGEEFAVVLPGRDGPAAARIAEQIREAVAQMECEFEQQRLEVTISCGVARAQPGEIAASLLKRADEALYASKSAGRNRGHMHDGQQCVPITRRDCFERVAPLRIASPRVNLLENGDFRKVCQDVRSRLLSLVECESD